MSTRLTTIIDLKTRLHLHSGSVLAVFFLAAYNRQVCPFIDGLAPFELTINLGIVLLFQMVLREVLFHVFATPARTVSLARHGYYLCIFTWCIAGLCASTFHAFKYPEFPISSHLKLLSSYWILGAVILGQWEYVLLELAERRHAIKISQPHVFLERVTRRIMEGYFLFTLAPVLVMLLVVVRYVYEGLIIRGVAIEVAYIGSFCVFIALLVATRYGQTLREDTRNILQGIQHIEHGKLNTVLDISRLDELGEMSQGINLMAAGLQLRERIKEAFGRFVAPNVAKEFIEKFVKQGKEVTMGGESRNVVVLMCDIRNFTPLAESMPPEKLTALLNGYFSEMVQAIQAHGGMVDKFIGDAIMAIFGMLDEQKNNALNAVRAAMEMQERLIQFNASLPAADNMNLRSGIGIHQGKVIAGYIGSVERLEFTVIGSPVNIAARIESMAKPPNPPILFSQEIAEQIKADIPTRYVETTSLKGVSSPVALYSVQEGFI